MVYPSKGLAELGAMRAAGGGGVIQKKEWAMHSVSMNISFFSLF